MRRAHLRGTPYTRANASPSRNASWTFVALMVLFSLALCAQASATIVVPLSEDSLVEEAVAIVIGHVTAIQANYDRPHATIFTNVTVTVEEVLKGAIPIGEITLHERGGSFGDLHSWVGGSPSFVLGEKVLLFLRPDRHGRLRVAHLYQGKFTVSWDPVSAEEFATRETPFGVQVRRNPLRAGAQAPQPHEVHRVRDLKDRIQGHTNTGPLPYAHIAPLMLVPSNSPDTVTGPIQAEFTLLGPARWFEPDDGGAVPMSINSAGEPLAPTSGFEQVRAGFHAWSGVSGSTFRYQDGGFTDAEGLQHDGINAVSFRDPLGDMDPPVNCTGTLAEQGFFYTTAETRTVNGTAFWRILDGDVVFNDGWSGCGFYESFANFAEVATHELGHVLGLDHSPDPDATMYYLARFDGRGAALGQDDVNGLRAIYPTFPLTVTLGGSRTGSVTSSPAGIDCGMDCTEEYGNGTTVTLTATAAAGFIFGGWGGDCVGTGTCVLTMIQPRNVTATFALPTYTLTVSKAGTGSGTVTSTPVGIDCGDTCSAIFNYNTGVTLNATAGNGAIFIGWSEPCAGTGPCTLIMNEMRDVTATFSASGTASAASAMAGGGGGGCFIATAAFGSPLAPQVELLRTFRDTYLLPSPIGQALVHGYYGVSPPVAAVIARSESLRAVARVALLPVLSWAALAMWSPTLAWGIVLLPPLAGVWLVGRRSRRRQGEGA
jgi:Matrixin/Divergent InlB B-repeat domain